MKLNIVITLVIFILVSFVAYFGVFSDHGLEDNLYGGYSALDNIVIIGIDDKSIQDLGRWPWDRIYFTELLEKIHPKVVGIDVGFYEDARNTEFKEAIDKDNIVLASEFTSFSIDPLKGEGMLKPVVGNYGYINFFTDSDGVTRSTYFGLGDHFSEKIYEVYTGDRLDLDGKFLINFAEGFRYYSFIDVLNDPPDLTGKIVLIGATSPSLHDNYLVPVSKGKAMPGVYLHANLLQTLMTGNNLKYIPLWVLIVIMLIFAFLVFFAVKYLHIAQASGVSFILIMLYIFTSIILFDYGVIMDLIYVPLTIIAVFFGNVGADYLLKKKERIKVSEEFEKYVSPFIIEKIMKYPTQLKLGGERRKITIFFSDIRAFTSLSEKIDPEELVALLNRYLTDMTDIILKNNGLVDKYIGDAIMAFWNAPVEEENHEALAAKTALEMMQCIREKYPDLDIGIGINTGEALVGNMGTEKRFDYTTIGDTVNIASRLEGLNKMYGTNIILAEETKEKLNGFFTRELDRVIVKGKKEPVRIFELRGSESPEGFSDALAFYYAGDFVEAVSKFAEVNDKTSKIFIDRCEELIKIPPKGWDGIWEHEVK